MDLPNTPDKPDPQDPAPIPQKTQPSLGEEPGFVAEEDIPLDGPDPVGQKMIEELEPGAEHLPRPKTSD